MKTVREVLLWGVETLKAQKNGEARADAEVLLAWALALERSQLYLKNEAAVPMEKATVYENALQRRLQGIPVAYITGKKEFMGLCFRVDRNVLVPRPETEILVEEAIKTIAKCKVQSAKLWNCLKKNERCQAENTEFIIADIGTGSGNIAVSLAHFMQGNKIYATDISKDALTLARMNAESYRNIEFIQGDLCQPLLERGLAGQIGLIISNPPYVPSDIINSLSPEVRAEPRLALDGGAGGLETISRLIPQAWTTLKYGGWLALEVGFNQTKEVMKIMTNNGFHGVYTKRDLAGMNRIVIGKKP